MFKLSKWYMDCVAPDGTAVVAYWADLVWGLVRFRYAQVMARRDGVLTDTATLRGGREPWPEPEGIGWHSARLGIEGHWRRLDPPVHQTLLHTTQGNLEWSCHVPRARGRVRLANGDCVEGLGYVERLDMTIRPWQLPIHELCWGRFLSERTGVVWITWRGPRPLTLLLVNGVACAGAAVGEQAVAWPTGRLELESGSVFREGTLATTVLARVPLLGRLVPRALRDTQETKWLRPGRMLTPNGQVETGWTLHEVVRFGGPS